MRIACTNINNRSIEMSKELISKSVFKYNGVLGRALFKLYDLGYQSSPSVFDLGDFRNALFYDFPNEVKWLRDNLRGSIAIEDELMLRYAILKTSDEDFRNILSVYLDIVIAQKSLNAYSVLVNKAKIPKKNDIVKVKSRLGISGSVSNCNAIPLDVPAIRESIILDEDEELITYNTSEILVKEIVKRLGYSEEDYFSYKKTGQAFFIEGISQEDELTILPIIVSGKVTADGAFGAELVKNINDYYNEFYKTHDSRIHCLNYEEVIFNNCLDERIALINKRRESFGTDSFRDFYVTTNEIIFAVKTGLAKFPTSYFKDNMIHLGVATLSHENRNEFSKINTLSGLCGEFIHESTVREKGWLAEGLPVSIKFGLLSNKRFKLSTLNYYPIYSVYYSNEDGIKSSNIKPLLGDEIQVIVSNISDIQNRLRVSSKAELFNKMFKATDVSLPSPDINRVKYETLVADLATALIYAECGELDYELCGTGYTWVTDELFYRASTEAEELFKSFGF